MRTEQDLDDAIDRAVRDIMSLDPRPGLRGRVLSRLERAERPWFAFPQLAAAAALILIIVAAVLLRSVGTPEPPVSPMVATREPASIHLPAPAERTIPDTVRKPAAGATAASRTGVPSVFPPRNRVAAASVPVDTTSPETVAPAAAAPPAELPSSELAPKPIVIEPLKVEPIVIPPIRPPG